MAIIKKILCNILLGIFRVAPRFLVHVIFGDIWRLRTIIQQNLNNHSVINRTLSSIGSLLAAEYWGAFGSWVGRDAIFEGPPTFPHGPYGFFCSNHAHVGRNCVIFQQVTIGSNTIQGSKRKGSPYLEDSVYIGSGAKIIGNVHVGKFARIGANCVVVKDVPCNSVTVIRGVESIVKEEPNNNRFVPL